MAITKKELARLVRVTRALGHWRESGTEKSFACPLDYEAKQRERERGLAHRFTVSHAVWDSGTSVAEVAAALADHLNPDSCSRVTA